MNQLKKAAYKGFTLLEILVVIGIIAILVGVTSVSYSTANKKARDSKRKTDLHNVSLALEQYFALCTAYPNPASGKVPSTITTPASGCTVANSAVMSSTPVDPQTGVAYTMAGGGTTYTVSATLESDTTTYPGCGAAGIYCISNQQ